MPLDIKTLCQYRLDRAKEDFIVRLLHTSINFMYIQANLNVIYIK